MRDAIAETHANNDGVTSGQVRVDELVRCQIFVYVADTTRREPGRAVPIDPAALGISAGGSQKPV